ncbi:TPA: hypothetical protein DCX15_04545 [bacterium]|nr:hypothetical protein [bacterium]
MNQLKGYFSEERPRVDISINGFRESGVIVNTSFTGALMLPIKKIEDFGLSLMGVTVYNTPNGELVPTEVYSGFLDWFGQNRRVSVLSIGVEASFLGMKLLHHCHLEMAPSENTLVISNLESKNST